MKRMLTAALALLLALSLCACGAQDTDDTPTYPAAFSGLETLIDTAREEGRLTVCGTGDEAYMTALCEKFEELFDIKTTYRAITAAQAGSARGDVWFGGSADTCRTLAADGKLLTYTPVHAADLTNAAYGDAGRLLVRRICRRGRFRRQQRRAPAHDHLRPQGLGRSDRSGIPGAGVAAHLPQHGDRPPDRVQRRPAAGPRQGAGLSGSAGHQRTVLHRRG